MSWGWRIGSRSPANSPRDQAFAGANLLLLPSRVEAFGMVVTEALARGIPAIVTPGGPDGGPRPNTAPANVPASSSVEPVVETEWTGAC